MTDHGIGTVWQRACENKRKEWLLKRYQWHGIHPLADAELKGWGSQSNGSHFCFNVLNVWNVLYYVLHIIICKATTWNRVAGCLDAGLLAWGARCSCTGLECWSCAALAQDRLVWERLAWNA